MKEAGQETPIESNQRSNANKRSQAGSNVYLVRSALVAALGGLLFGFDTAVIAGTTSDLINIYALSPALLGVTVSIALWGTVCGALTAGIPGDRFGRRDSLRGLAVLYFVSALGCGLSWSWGMLIVFRFIEGLAIGASSVVGPMYIAEIAPARLRGRLVGLFQLNVVFGIMFAYFSNFLIGLCNLGQAEWRFKLGISALPALSFFFLLFGIPRSPRWLAQKGRFGEAANVLRAIGEPNPTEVLKDIERSISIDRQETDHLFSPRYRFSAFLAISIGFLNQLCGINAILYYLNDIFKMAGFTKVSSDFQSVLVGLTLFIFTAIAMSVIDKFGRRPLLLIGSAGMSMALSAMAFLFFTMQHQRYLVWLLVLYIAFFAFSQGTVIWVYISEIFPTGLRARGQSLGSSSHWLMNALISGIFPVFANASGGLPFAIFAGMTVLQFFLVLLTYPETKGMPLEQVDAWLHRSRNQPRPSR